MNNRQFERIVTRETITAEYIAQDFYNEINKKIKEAKEQDRSANSNDLFALFVSAIHSDLSAYLQIEVKEADYTMPEASYNAACEIYQLVFAKNKDLEEILSRIKKESENFPAMELKRNGSTTGHRLKLYNIEETYKAEIKNIWDIALTWSLKLDRLVHWLNVPSKGHRLLQDMLKTYKEFKELTIWLANNKQQHIKTLQEAKKKAETALDSFFAEGADPAARLTFQLEQELRNKLQEAESKLAAKEHLNAQLTVDLFVVEQNLEDAQNNLKSLRDTNVGQAVASIELLQNRLKAEQQQHQALQNEITSLKVQLSAAQMQIGVLSAAGNGVGGARQQAQHQHQEAPAQQPIEAKRLITALEKYIERIAGKKIDAINDNDSFDYSKGFWFFKNSRAINREINFRLARVMLTQLKNAEPQAQAITQENVIQSRAAIITHNGLFRKPDYKERGINSNELKAVIKLLPSLKK